MTTGVSATGQLSWRMSLDVGEIFVNMQASVFFQDGGVHGPKQIHGGPHRLDSACSAEAPGATAELRQVALCGLHLGIQHHALGHSYQQTARLWSPSPHTF